MVCVILVVSISQTYTDHNVLRETNFECAVERGQTNKKKRGKKGLGQKKKVTVIFDRLLATARFLGVCVCVCVCVCV